MVSIPNISIFFGAEDRKRGRKGLWLGAALAIATAGAGLAEEVSNGVVEPLQTAVARPDAEVTGIGGSIAPAAAETASHHPAAAPGEARSPPGAEQQRRLFMLLLLNSAGPLRPYNGLSR
jgi:hypothetical protein